MACGYDTEAVLEMLSDMALIVYTVTEIVIVFVVR